MEREGGRRAGRTVPYAALKDPILASVFGNCSAGTISFSTSRVMSQIFSCSDFKSRTMRVLCELKDEGTCRITWFIISWIWVSGMGEEDVRA